MAFQTGRTQGQLHQQQTLESERKRQASIFKVIKITRVIFLIDAGKPETHVDMESRLGVKITALTGESVLLIDIISHILQYLTQVLTARHRSCTFFCTLSYTIDKDTLSTEVVLRY